MKITSQLFSRRAFTLVELMFSTTIGLVVSGAVLTLMFQSSREQRLAMVNITVEEKSYMLDAALANILRSVSVNQGVQPDYPSQVKDGAGNLIPYTYQSIFVFSPMPSNTNYPSGYMRGYLQYTPASGLVVYTPDVRFTNNTVLMSNSPTCRMTNFQFSTSFNLDFSQNNSLVNVSYQMDDNNFTRSSPTNNPASVFRSYSLQMRND